MEWNGDCVVPQKWFSSADNLESKNIVIREADRMNEFYSSWIVSSFNNKPFTVTEFLFEDFEKDLLYYATGKFFFICFNEFYQTT